MIRRVAKGVTSWRGRVAILSVFTQACWAGVRLMLGYRALEFGADPFMIGIVTSALAVPGLMGAVLVGRLADRFGCALMVVAGLIITIAGIAVTLVFPSFVILVLSAILLGSGSTFIMIGNQSYVAHASDARNRDGAFGLLAAGTSAGQMLAPFATTAFGSATGDTTQANTMIGLWVCVGFCVIAFPLALLLRNGEQKLPARVPTPTEQSHPSSLVRIPGMWRAMTVSGIVLVSVDVMYMYMPAWGQEKGLSTVSVGLLLTVRAAVSVVSRVGMSQLIARFGRAALLVSVLGAGTIAFIAVGFVGFGGGLFLMFILGFALGIPQPLTMSWVVSITDPNNQGAALGLRVSVNRLMQILMPLAIAGVAGGFGVIGIFLANAVLLGGATTLSIWAGDKHPEL